MSHLRDIFDTIYPRNSLVSFAKHWDFKIRHELKKIRISKRNEISIIETAIRFQLCATIQTSWASVITILWHRAGQFSINKYRRKSGNVFLVFSPHKNGTKSVSPAATWSAVSKGPNMLRTCERMVARATGFPGSSRDIVMFRYFFVALRNFDL